MGKFSNTVVTPKAPISSTGRTETNPQGGIGHLRDVESELFLLAVTNLVGEDTFYEQAEQRDCRFRDLIRQVVSNDPGWIARFVPYLRSELNLRSVAVVMAAEYALALRELPWESRQEAPAVRGVVAAALQRPDEPGEFIGYWKLRTGSRTLPGGVQRGVADAVARLFNQRAALKYDGKDNATRLGDVIELVHPAPVAPWQADLYRYLLDRRHHPQDVRVSLERLPVIHKRAELEVIPKEHRREWLRGVESDAADTLKSAGATWEWLSGWLPGGMDAEAWEFIIPSMGYMALLRNLRNFDETGVSDAAAERVAWQLGSPDQVARSKQFPLRFYSAFREVPSFRWSLALEKAIHASLVNVPSLPGRTLILIDTSDSMNDALSKRSKLQRIEAAVVFGLALAQRAEYADVVSFSTETKVFKLTPAEALLKSVQRFQAAYCFNSGTLTSAAVRKHYRPGFHSRVIILTDEQESREWVHDPRSLYGYRDLGPSDIGSLVAKDTPLFTINLAGYRLGHAPSGSANRYVLGGLTDKMFQLVPIMERSGTATWPF